MIILRCMAVLQGVVVGTSTIPEGSHALHWVATWVILFFAFTLNIFQEYLLSAFEAGYNNPLLPKRLNNIAHHACWDYDLVPYVILVNNNNPALFS